MPVVLKKQPKKELSKLSSITDLNSNNMNLKSHSSSTFLTDQVNNHSVHNEKMMKSISPQSKTRLMLSPEMQIFKRAEKIKSLVDLNIVKNQYRKQLLRSKSKQKLNEENQDLIMKIEDAPPQIQSWNFKYEIQKRGGKSPRAIQRERNSIEIFEKNMQMIDRVENTGPKVDSWNSLKPPRHRNKVIQQFKKEEEIRYDQNIKIIKKIENVPPRVEPWLNKKMLRLELLNKKKTEKSELPKMQKLRVLIESAEQRLKQQANSRSLTRNKRVKTLPSARAKEPSLVSDRKKNIPQLSSNRKVKKPFHPFFKSNIMKAASPQFIERSKQATSQTVSVKNPETLRNGYKDAIKKINQRQLEKNKFSLLVKFSGLQTNRKK